MAEALGGVDAASFGALTAARFERYLDVLLERNATLNLTGAKDRAGVWEHVRDSLTLVPYVLGPLVDIGSGGGFPGLPLAIATGVATTLVEASRKKARFLEELVAALDLPVTVVAERAEAAARDPVLREAFATATARAVGDLTTVLELTVPFLRVGGLAVLQRGSVDPAERVAAADAAFVLGARVEADDGRMAGMRDRTLIIARKVTATGARFPRRNGIPSKRPLCWDNRGKLS